jgi:hypothetical protein
MMHHTWILKKKAVGCRRQSHMVSEKKLCVMHQVVADPTQNVRVVQQCNFLFILFLFFNDI